MQSKAKSRAMLDPVPWLSHLQGDGRPLTGLESGPKRGWSRAPSLHAQLPAPGGTATLAPSPRVLVRSENSYTGNQLFLQRPEIEAGKPFSCTMTHPWDTAAIPVELCPAWGSPRIAPQMGCALALPGLTALALLL